MGAKRKNTSLPEKSSPAGKKACVIETPESIALSKLIEAFDGEVGAFLPSSVVEMVKAVAGKCLMTQVEHRDNLETTFAAVVSQALQTAKEGLQNMHKSAAEALVEEEERVKTLQATLDSAIAAKEQADKELEDAAAARSQASDKKAEGEAELEKHSEEEMALTPKKKMMESDLAALKEVQTTVRGPPLKGKKGEKALQKLQKALKEVEAPQSLIAGIGEAIGAQTDFDQHFVGEGAKLLYDKSAQIEAELAKHGETVAEYAEKTTALQSKVEGLSGDLSERDGEHAAALAKVKECAAAIKDAEKQKKQGDKTHDKAVQYRDEKAAAERVGADAEAQLKYLLERTGATTDAPEVPEVAVEAVEAM
jgi:hypothetical protein